MRSYPTRAEVDAANSHRLSKLPTAERRYYARDCVIVYHDFDPEEEPRPVYVDPAKVKRADISLERLVVSKEIPLKVLVYPPERTAHSSLTMRPWAGRSAGDAHQGQISGQNAICMLEVDWTAQNLVQGKLVNGTKGRIEEFITVDEAYERDIPRASECGPRVDQPSSEQTTSVELRGPPRDKAWDGRWPLVMFETGGELLCNLCVFDVKSTEGLLEAVRHQVRPPTLHCEYHGHAYAFL